MKRGDRDEKKSWEKKRVWRETEEEKEKGYEKLSKERHLQRKRGPESAEKYEKVPGIEDVKRRTGGERKKEIGKEGMFASGRGRRE